MDTRTCLACMCLTGFPDAIQSVYPKTDVQLCIVHQIRNSVKYVGSKNPKEFLSDLKLVYGASTSETGSILCDKFNVFYGFVWKNGIKFVPLPRQERMRWQDPHYLLQSALLYQKLSRSIQWLPVLMWRCQCTCSATPCHPSENDKKGSWHKRKGWL